MNFKKVLSSSALAVVTAASPIVISPTAQAADGCGAGWHWSGRKRTCVISGIKHPNYICLKGYRRGQFGCLKDTFEILPRFANAYNISNIFYSTGVFQQRRGRRWVERNMHGTYRLQETHRNRSTVYLQDPNRRIKVELNLRHNKVILNAAFNRRVLHRIVQAY